MSLSLSACTFGNLEKQSTNKSTSESVFSSKTIHTYLKNNSAGIDLKVDKPFESMKMLENDLEGKEIIFTAELHGVEANQLLEIEFVRYFKEKTNFKYLLSELPYSSAYYLNQYLTTGDKRILDQYHAPLKGTFAWTKNNYAFWEKLYELNGTLPVADRIQVVGVDIEHQSLTSYQYLVDVLPKEAPPELLETSIENLKLCLSAIKSGDKKIEAESSKSLQAHMLAHEDLYKTYLGESYFGFKLVVDNLINGNVAYGVPAEQWNKTRDEMIYKNFQSVHSTLPKGKYYGQWGLNHAYQSAESDTTWFAAYLNSAQSEFRGKLLSITYQYKNCTYMSKKSNNKYGTASQNYIFPALNSITNQSPLSYNLYKLDATDSPFFKMPLNEEGIADAIKKPVTDYYQYVLCIKNSGASEPLKTEN